MTKTTTKNRRKKSLRTKKTRNGVSLASLLILLASLLPPALLAQKPEASEAVIAGTVFRDPGFAFPHVEVTLAVTTPPPGKKAGKPRKASTNDRGEFAFRVPAGAAKYSVRAVANGFTPHEQRVSVNADERVDVYITLKPLAK